MESNFTLKNIFTVKNVFAIITGIVIGTSTYVAFSNRLDVLENKMKFYNDSPNSLSKKNEHRISALEISFRDNIWALSDKINDLRVQTAKNNNEILKAIYNSKK